LQYAHDHRLIHRDVKPENILLGAQDEILLSDFSLVTVAHSTASLKTLDNAGTVHYMAPEQLQGKPRPSSDQYALGIMVYEWLCGERPFDGATPIEVAVQHITVPLPSLLEKMPELSLEIVAVVERALAKDLKQRFPSVMEFVHALGIAIEQAYPKIATVQTTTEEVTAPTADDAVPVQSEPSIVRLWNEAAQSLPPLDSASEQLVSAPPLRSDAIPSASAERVSPLSSTPLPLTSSTRSSSSYFTVLDIGSTYARAAIIRINTQQHIELLGIGRYGQQEGNLVAGMVNDIQGTVTACNEALLKAERMAGKLIAPDALVGVGGELMRGTSLTISMERATPLAPIATHEVATLIDQAAQELLSRLQQQFALLTGERAPIIEIVDMKIASMLLDGQPVLDPIGLPGRQLSFLLFVNCILSEQRQIIAEVVDKLDLNLAGLTTTTAALAHYLQASDGFPQNAVLLDVGGGVSRVALIFKNQLMRLGAFAFGGEDFTLHLAEQMNLERQAAEYLKLSYGRGMMKGEPRRNVQSLLNPLYQRWLDELASQLEALSGERTLPADFYLAGCGLAFPDFRLRFRNFPWVDYLPFVQPPLLHQVELERHPWVKDSRSLLRDAGEVSLLAIGTTALLPSPSPLHALLLQFLQRHLSSSSSL
jgi:cell division protein FtsA